MEHGCIFLIVYILFDWTGVLFQRERAQFSNIKKRVIKKAPKTVNLLSMKTKNLLII